MLVLPYVIQGMVDFDPASAARLLETEHEARDVLTEPGILHPIQAARLLPHCAERFPHLAGGGFLKNARAREILDSATGKLQSAHLPPLSSFEGEQVFASFAPQRIRALRAVGPIPEGEQRWLDARLHEAVSSNRCRSIAPLMAAGAHVRTRSGFHSLAHEAARNGFAEVMPAFLAGGMSIVNMLRVDANGWTPIYYAAFHGHHGVIRALLDSGVSQQDAMRPDLLNRSPGHIAAETGHGQVIETLLRGGIGMAEFFRRTVWDWTAAHHAARCGHAQVIRELARGGATWEQLMLLDRTEDTALTLAAERGHVAVIEAMAEAMHAAGRPWTELMRADYRGHTPAHLAAYRGHPGVIPALAAAGVPWQALMQVDFSGRTPAHLAALEGRAWVMAELAAAGVLWQELMKPDTDGFTPLDLAEHHGHRAVIEQALLSAGAPQYALVMARPHTPAVAAPGPKAEKGPGCAVM